MKRLAEIYIPIILNWNINGVIFIRPGMVQCTLTHARDTSRVYDSDHGNKTKYTYEALDDAGAWVNSYKYDYTYDSRWQSVKSNTYSTWGQELMGSDHYKVSVYL